MNKLRTNFNRFCYNNRDKGIPNLMLYVVLASALVYLMSMFDKNLVLYRALCFDRSLILRGQVWRLVTFVFTGAFSYGNVIWVLVSSLCYFSLGRAIEAVWGTLRFNLYYLAGVVLMVIYCMITGAYADPYYLNISLLLCYSTLYPNAQFLLLFIIPVKAWAMALVDIALLLAGVFMNHFPHNLLPLVALLNYFLFFGKDVLDLIPPSWKAKHSRRSTSAPKKDPIQFRPKKPSQQPGYTHRCTICGRTDVSDPQLEFRYCSRCNGYHCYCQDHISNHDHIE